MKIRNRLDLPINFSHTTVIVRVIYMEIFRILLRFIFFFFFFFFVAFLALSLSLSPWRSAAAAAAVAVFYTWLVLSSILFFIMVIDEQKYAILLKMYRRERKKNLSAFTSVCTFFYTYFSFLQQFASPNLPRP